MDKAVSFIAEQLSIKSGDAQKIFDSFWDFIEEKIVNEGEVTIDGLGTFSFKEVEKDGKITYELQFDPETGFKNAIGK
ncbi:MAG: HU family DNA-binding protein [Spirochaetes bacterium]|nr:HU family DNA-binding protein [Spirochaetota bacterium]